MRSKNLKILLGGVLLLLAMLACSTASSALPTLATFPPAQEATPTVVPLPATVVPPTEAVTLPLATEAATQPPASPAQGNPNLTLVTAPSLRVIDMLDINNGWGITDTGVVRTLDGGASWYDVTPAGLNGAPVAPYFLDSSTAWLAAMGADPSTGTLFHTSDGGSTWSSVAVPFGGGSLMFVDPLHGWELVGLSAGMSHEAVSIYQTSDAGATWSRVFTNDPNTAGTNNSLPLVGDKNGITALDSRRAWVTGAQPSDNFIYIYITLDGGTTWSHQELSLPAGYTGAMTGPSLPVFFDANEAVLPVLMFANTNGTDFYLSHDGGLTWSASTALGQGGFVSVASPTDFFVWDGGKKLSFTQDAGANWATVKPNVNIQDNLDFIQFIDAVNGWAVTADANGHCMLYRTSDGGATWTVLVP
jgi:photosystem II stability/assembly factor-like uncharacterized protein